MRLIDKDALLAEYDRIHIGEAGRARKLIEDAPEVSPYTDEEIQKIQDMQSAEVKKAFELGMEDAEPQWIPCSERLPEDRRYVLVTFRFVYGLIDHGITWYGESENKWDTSREVIAWMPLPEPWKGEES